MNDSKIRNKHNLCFITTRLHSLLVFIAGAGFMCVLQSSRVHEVLGASTQLEDYFISYYNSHGKSKTENKKDKLKVLSYSLYGKHPKYVNGMHFTVEANAINFPGWQVWIYHDEEVPSKILEELSSSNSTNIVKTINVKRDLPKWVSQNVNPMSWRFFVASDPTVHAYAIRDSDSLSSKREKAAVDEWLQSGKSFHIMRDHPMHHPEKFAEILGGMWGGLHSAVPHMDKLLREYYNSSRTIKWGEDQDFLWENILPLAVNDCLQHDSYYCIESGAIAFPMDREKPHEYVGNTMNRMDGNGKLRNMGHDLEMVDPRMRTKDMVERFNKCRDLRKEKEKNSSGFLDTPFIGTTKLSSTQKWANWAKEKHGLSIKQIKQDFLKSHPGLKIADIKVVDEANKSTGKGL